MRAPPLPPSVLHSFGTVNLFRSSAFRADSGPPRSPSRLPHLHNQHAPLAAGVTKGASLIAAESPLSNRGRGCRWGGAGGGRGYRKQLTRQQNNNASSLPIIKARRISSLSTEQAECEILLAPLFMLFNCRGRSDQEIYFTRGLEKVTSNENADDEFKEGGNVGSAEVRLGSAEVGCVWGWGVGAGRAAPVFLPGTCFVKSSLFISQSDYKRRSIFRFCGDSEAFGKPLLYQTAANPPPPNHYDK